MQLLVLILKRTDLLADLLQQLAEIGVRGATVVEGTGMARALINDEDLPMFGMLRHVFKDAERESSKVIMMVLSEETMPRARECIHSVLGDFSAPNSGVLFSVPVGFVEGIGD